MGCSKLCLLLLLGTYALAQQDAGNDQVCYLAKRFKNFRRFVYNYEAETFNGVNGGTDNKSGPKISCKVEVDVPQTCSFILRTTECSLSEISEVDAAGNPVYRPAARAEAFKAAMAKNVLKFTVGMNTKVELYPEEDEPVNILNVKRGIVSALLVPGMEQEMTDMPTVHGVCPSDLSVDSTQEDVVTGMTVTRDLSQCDWFTARRQDTSPLALISGMNFPLSKMISSSQLCSYQFDGQKKHMTSGSCTEKHLFLPLSHQSEYGISTLVKQTMTLQEVAKINDRIFELKEANLKFLPMEVADEKSPFQTKDDAIATLQQLNSLSQTPQGEERASLFHKLVSEFRGLKADVLGPAVREMMSVSNSLTLQALVQCGTPECTSALLRILRRFDNDGVALDATVYALGMLSNPSPLMVKDMLEMAQNRQSKPIMYALSIAVKKLYASKGLTPEITAVSEFVTSLLGADCAGDKDLTYLTLRVVGNMGDALEEANAAIKDTLLKCMRQPATTLSVQLAAIQAFRRMTVTSEVRTNLQRVSQYPKGAVQKRLAAYLILMRKPQDSDIDMVKKMLTQEQNVQIKSFVTSHIYNIISSTDPEIQIIGQKIVEALEDTDVTTHNDYTTKSRNYKLGVGDEGMQAAVQGNVIFDSANHMPREVMLETTLKAFGFNMDIWEVGMEGRGFEPTIDVLFGKNGFFPDTVSKAIYWAEDKMPPKMREVLEKWVAPLKSQGQRVPENLGKELYRNFNKLVKDLQSQESPEAMAYLRFMGTELGNIKGNDLTSMAEDLLLKADSALRTSTVVISTLPLAIEHMLMSGTKQEIFAHYMFMDNKFLLSTASGLPLTFAMSGTFTPGAKGGIKIASNMKELSFMPSVGVEFVTKMGVHVPEFVESAVELHTNMYHESALNAKITMEQSQVKLSIPAPQGTTKFLRMNNKVMIVGAGQATKIPHKQHHSECKTLFTGVKYCTKTLLADTGARTDVPYCPLNGETLFAVDIQPTNEVTEYTATIAYKLLSEGKDGRQKVDSLKMALRAEGDQPTEATATMKYNRNRNVFTTQVEIPDFDVEAGVKVSMTDSNSKGKSLVLEISNKNIPQLSLIGRAKLQSMTDGMAQVQLLVPSLKTDAAITATMSKTNGLTMEIKSDVKLPDTSSVQAVIFKYGEEQAEVQLVSNVNADTKNLVAFSDDVQFWLWQFVQDVLDQQVVKTDMKMRHIINKGVEAGNIWMEKIATDVPYIQNLNIMAYVEKPSMPENLFMNLESKFVYQFNKDRLTISVPLPLGGKSSEELKIPPMVTSPQILLPQVGVKIAPREIQIPAFTIPSEYELTLPLLGMAEVSAKINSSYYNWEATVSAGNNTAEFPSYLAKFNIMADSPIKLLSFSAEGATKMTDTAEKTIELAIDSSLNHMFVKTGFNVLNTLSVTDNALSTGRYNIYATSPAGLDTSLTITTQFTLDSNLLSGDINADGTITVGPVAAMTTYLHTFSVEPAKKQARMESTLRVDSEMLKVVNKFKGTYADEELLVEYNTDINMNPIKHTTKTSLRYKDVKLTLLSDSVTKADETMLRSQIEISSSEAQLSLRIENQAGDTVNRVYSLITGSIKPSSLEVNADASMNIFSSLASHKATLVVNTNGLTTSCTTTAQHSPMTFENVFHGGVDTSGATMSLVTKGGIKGNKAELKVEGSIVSTEVSFNGVLKGNLFDIDTRNTVDLKLNEDGLSLSNNMVGSFNEMRTVNAHSLSLTLSSFTLHSKTENVLDKSNSYMHEITVNMEPYTASVIVKNDLKIMEITFGNDAQFSAERYTLELTGTMKGVFSEEELKHTYEMKFVDMVLSAKCNTNGKLLGSHVTHSADMEIAGLTMKFNDVANFNSPSLRLDSTVKTVAAPFTLTIDAIFNSDGGVYLYGKQSGEMYSKFLLKAEPLLFTHSFEYRASTSHELEGRPAIKTNMENKFNSLLSLEEQSVTLKTKCKVNDHTLDEEIKAYNNIETIGIEMEGVISSPIISESNTDYSISGFVKYAKNSDSHFIQIPFVEHLPAAIEKVKTSVMKLMDQSIEMLKDIDSKYEISAKLQNKVSELKEAIDNFDLNRFVQNVRKQLNRVESVLLVNFPGDKIKSALKSAKDTVMAFIKKHNIATKFSAMYAKIEEILSSYEVEKVIEAIMDEIVKIMKQYQVREKIQSVFVALRSIEFQPLLKKALAPVQAYVNELYSFDFKQLIEDISDYFMEIVQKIKSFDYDTFAVELKEKAAEMSKIPCFGKLNGEFRFTSPHYQFKTTADLNNVTATSDTPEFKINLNSQAKSTLAILDFTADASAHFAAPEMSRLTVSENIDVESSCFTLDHEGTVTFHGLSAQASGETKAKVTTELYAADLVNKVIFAMENGLSASADTSYKHSVNAPRGGLFTEALINQKTVFQLEDGTARLTFKNLASEKFAVQEVSDEVTHKSDMEVVMDLHTAKVTFTGETGCSHFKINHNLVADMCIFRHVIVDAKVETETPFMKSSVAEAKFQAKLEDMKIDFTASHNAVLVGLVDGIVSSSALALITPNELILDTKNKGNAKITLPFKLSGKVDLQNDIALTLNSDTQQASWTGLARFNQYKYSHLFTVDNSDEEIQISSQINGEANLDVLKERFSIPEIRVPFVGVRTRRVESFSLWEDTRLGILLMTTQQTLDMNSKMKYKKNPKVITIDMNLEPIISAINTNVKALHKKVLIGKDKAAATFATSYNKAKAGYEQYSIDLPKTITVPAYKVPVMNVEMSTFTIPLPDASLITMPTLHVPSALSKLTLPKITLPKIQSIRIPVMGDLTYELTMKTAIVTVKTDASILNKDHIVMKLDVSSSSVEDILAGKIQGNVDLDVAAGFKMGSTLSVKHLFVEGNHDSSINLSYDNVETSISNSLKVKHLRNMEFYQTATVESVEGLVVSMSSPAAGIIAGQVQMRRPAQMNAKLYGRYPSEPTTDVDILGLKVSLMDSERPMIQTSCNMEMPIEVMAQVRKHASKAIDVLSVGVLLTSEEMSRIKRSVESAGEKGKLVVQRTVEKLSKENPADVITAVIDNTIWMLYRYKERAEMAFDATVKVLRDTPFQIPFVSGKLYGFEIYEGLSEFVSDVVEEIVEIPSDIADFLSTLFQFVRDIEFKRPGANYMITVGDVFDSLASTLRPYQDRLIVFVRELGSIRLEDITTKFSELMQTMYEASEGLLQTLKSMNVDKISAFVTGVYNDFINAIGSTIISWIMEKYRMVDEAFRP